MRFLCLYRPAAGENGPPPRAEDFARMGAFIEDMVKTGALLATDGLAPSAQGARVRVTGGEFTVMDGPFTETKELIASYAMIQAKSRQEAVELTRRFLECVGGDGEVEVRQVFEPTDFPAETFTPGEQDRERKWREEMARQASHA